MRTKKPKPTDVLVGQRVRMARLMDKDLPELEEVWDTWKARKPIPPVPVR